MNPKKRLQYIWDYYKLPIIGIPLAILLILFVVKSLSTDTEPDFSLYLINQPVTEEERAALASSILKTLCPDGSE